MHFLGKKANVVVDVSPLNNYNNKLQKMNHVGAYSPLKVSLIFQENFKLTFFPKAKQAHATHEAFFVGNF